MQGSKDVTGPQWGGNKAGPTGSPRSEEPLQMLKAGD